MSYEVVYTEQFHEALDAQLTYLEEQGAPESRIAAWLSELRRYSSSYFFSFS